MDAVDVLMEARAYIEKGWCQNSLGREGEGIHKQDLSEQELANADQVCASGAILRGGGNWDHDHPDYGAYVLLSEAISPQLIIEWNDTPGRTQEEVLEAFDRAIGIGLERAGER